MAVGRPRAHARTCCISCRGQRPHLPGRLANWCGGRPGNRQPSIRFRRDRASTASGETPDGGQPPEPAILVHPVVSTAEVRVSLRPSRTRQTDRASSPGAESGFGSHAGSGWAVHELAAGGWRTAASGQPVRRVCPISLWPKACCLRPRASSGSSPSGPRESDGDQNDVPGETDIGKPIQRQLLRALAGTCVPTRASTS